MSKQDPVFGLWVPTADRAPANPEGFGRRCLRSELERILAEADAGLQIEKLEITGL